MRYIVATIRKTWQKLKKETHWRRFEISCHWIDCEESCWRTSWNTGRTCKIFTVRNICNNFPREVINFSRLDWILINWNVLSDARWGNRVINYSNNSNTHVLYCSVISRHYLRIVSILRGYNQGLMRREINIHMVK